MIALYQRGYRDGRAGREPREACEVYLEGWWVGVGVIALRAQGALP